MKLEELVEVVAKWSHFRGRRGRVVQVEPCVLVLLEGEETPLRFGPSELVPVPSPNHPAGAE